MVIQPGIEHVGFVSRTVEQTRLFGRCLGEGAMPGDVILLRGPFGAGKTTLVQGIAAGLQVDRQVTSPSFTLINEYYGRLTLYHVDLFRLNELDLEMEQAVAHCEESEGLTVVEWPDLLPHDLTASALRVDMQILGDSDRSLVVHAEGSRWSGVDLAAMMRAVLMGESWGKV